MNESEKDVLDEEIKAPDDTTDWETRAKELENKIGRARDSRKSLKEKYETEIADLKTQLELKADLKDKKPDDKLLERFNKLARKTAGVVEADEVEFFEKWKKENGYENIDDDEVVIGKKGFQTEFADFRTTKANLRATSEIQGGTGESGAKSTPDYWISKATKGTDGKLVFPEETPKDIYPKIVAKLGENEPGASSGKLTFHDQ